MIPSMETLRQAPDSQKVFDAEVAFYHGQKWMLSQLRLMMNEAGMKTSRLDAMIDEHEAGIDSDMIPVMAALREKARAL